MRYIYFYGSGGALLGSVFLRDDEQQMTVYVLGDYAYVRASLLADAPDFLKENYYAYIVAGWAKDITTEKTLDIV